MTHHYYYVFIVSLLPGNMPGLILNAKNVSNEGKESIIVMIGYLKALKCFISYFEVITLLKHHEITYQVIVSTY